MRDSTRVIPERSGSKLEKTSLRTGVRDRSLTANQPANPSVTSGYHYQASIKEIEDGINENGSADVQESV